jgi:CxxC motif-containing protein
MKEVESKIDKCPHCGEEINVAQLLAKKRVLTKEHQIAAGKKKLVNKKTETCG